MSSILLEDIKRKEEHLLNEVSDKERFFYLYLTKGEISANFSDLGPIDKVCLAAFTKIQNQDLDAIVERNKNARPVAGSHFSYNLISLCAFAIYDRRIVDSHVRDYFQKHGLKDKFIINHLFGNSFILKNENTTSIPSIDALIDDIFLKNQFEDALALIIKALEDCSDPIELFIIRQSYSKISQFHSNPAIERENRLLKEELALFTSSVNRKADRFVGILTLSFLPFCFLIIKWWDEKGLESIFTAWAAAIYILEIGLYQVLKKRFSLDEFLEKLSLRVVKWWFKVHKLDYRIVRKLLEEREV
ncbi:MULTISPECIES: hypothetical protein [Xanthocytophaga]|uniref:Uncharacterized protein n=2 Tax=Xanthocytophaga TaxID=3078918 RepID=A0AAE3QV51_9BACT|nr:MULTISPECIES: hypothetical protein [Xanthocytophaga]MDJ1483098.1 hypothetical protein [Xanthocytophaga flavus]MDJ1503631.1 hypothetical protein [Xanthocytophaga agilis]